MQARKLLPCQPRKPTLLSHIHVYGPTVHAKSRDRKLEWKQNKTISPWALGRIEQHRLWLTGQRRPAVPRIWILCSTWHIAVAPTRSWASLAFLFFLFCVGLFACGLSRPACLFIDLAARMQQSFISMIYSASLQRSSWWRFVRTIQCWWSKLSAVYESVGSYGCGLTNSNTLRLVLDTNNQSALVSTPVLVPPSTVTTTDKQINNLNEKQT